MIQTSLYVHYDQMTWPFQTTVQRKEHNGKEYWVLSPHEVDHVSDLDIFLSREQLREIRDSIDSALSIFEDPGV